MLLSPIRSPIRSPFYSPLAKGGGGIDPIRALFANGLLGGWYDPSDLSTLFKDVAGTVPVTTDGDAVALMLDKSGSGNHLSQATPSARPLYKTSGGLHWLQWDGVDDRLLRADTPSFRAANMGLALAFRVNSTARNDLMGCGEGSAYASNNWIVSTNGGTLTVFPRSPAATLTSGTIANGSDYAATVSWGGTNVVRRLNGGTAASSPAVFGTNSTKGFALGAGPTDVGGGGNYVSGRIYAAIIRNDDWSAAEGTSINQYLAAKSGAILA